MFTCAVLQVAPCCDKAPESACCTGLYNSTSKGNCPCGTCLDRMRSVIYNAFSVTGGVGLFFSLTEVCVYHVVPFSDGALKLVEWVCGFSYWLIRQGNCSFVFVLFCLFAFPEGLPTEKNFPIRKVAISETNVFFKQTFQV